MTDQVENKDKQIEKLLKTLESAEHVIFKYGRGKADKCNECQLWDDAEDMVSCYYCGVCYCSICFPSVESFNKVCVAIGCEENYLCADCLDDYSHCKCKKCELPCVNH